MAAMDTLVTPDEQVANAQSLLVRAVRRLGEHGMTMRDARRLVESARVHRHGRRWLRNVGRYNAAYLAVAALRDWRDVKAACAAGSLRAVADDGLPF